MKKILLLLTVFSMVFTSCDPLEDINEEIDAQENAIVGDTEYTLTNDDYTEDIEDGGLGLSFTSFSSEDDAKSAIPAFLTTKYPAWGNKSSVLVGYNLYIGNAEGVSDFTSSDIYEFTNSDYATTGSDAFGFYPDVDAASAIPAILDTQVASPTEGQIVLAKYDQYTEDPVVGLADLVAYNFAGSFEGWSAVEEYGDDEVWTTESGNVRGNGYFGDQTTNSEWLVSPLIDLSDESDLKFQITQELDFAGDTSLVKILVSTDYTDDILTATWDEITLGMPATGDMASSEDYDFSAYDGQTINIAFKYSSIGDDPSTAEDEGDASRWRIASMKIKTLGATGDTNSKGEYFMYTGGSWEAVEGVYYLSSGDFDSMGEGSGQPGQYDNFGSSIPPNNYLPTFLSLNFPYAQEEDELFVIYDYYSSSSGAQIRGNMYTVIDGEFVGHESTISTTLQFGHDGTTWVPDNTIKYTLIRNADYEYMASQLTDSEYSGLIGNLASYGDFDYNWTDSQINYALIVLLNHIDSTAEEGQKYTLTYVIYDNGENDYQTSFIKTDGEWVVN